MRGISTIGVATGADGKISDVGSAGIISGFQLPLNVAGHVDRTHLRLEQVGRGTVVFCTSSGDNGC